MNSVFLDIEFHGHNNIATKLGANLFTSSFGGILTDLEQLSLSNQIKIYVTLTMFTMITCCENIDINQILTEL